ncbi:hypothetical protein RHMOL_Rhmol12G0037600 [Rhododendron molle]|uniref:Uncharacterized protein n=1 Tax=Rhododendron molle TaxID=49168 RepID=A0ACC0LEZ8_RHOML|nr:hypothetical protein RHMOL_Rhmol12G0037600 [Rhododendron molle]
MESRPRTYAELLTSTSTWPSCQPLQIDIPDQIVLEILSRLPIRFLLRFRCVCKVWRSTISHPKFTFSLPRYRQIASRTRDGTLYSIDHNEASSSDLIFKPMLNNNNNLDASSINRLFIRILGSCNGLLLVSQYSDLYLWNPSTGQCNKVLSFVVDRSEDYYVIASSGLCYDSLTDDYKAVMVNRGLATVVSFKRRRWTTRTCLSHGNNEEIWHPGPLVNEKLHWMITDYGQGNLYFPTNWIVHFDPFTDEFVEIPMPPLPHNGERNMIISGLGDLHGCLCMTRFVCKSGVEPIFIEVLVMEEYGVGESWTSVFIMSNDVMGLPSLYRNYGLRLYGDLVPLYFTRNSEVLVVVHADKLLVYNPDEMSLWRIRIPSNHSPARDLRMVSFMESLSSPAAYAQKEDWIVEGSDALNLVHYIWHRACSTCWGDGDSCIIDDDDKDSIEKEENRVWKGFWKKDENQEKFCRKVTARLYYLSARQKKQEVQQRTITKSKLIRMYNQKKKPRNNMEALDLHKQVLDFFVK